MGEFRRVIAPGIIPWRHSGIEARFQVPQLTERADDPSADLLDPVAMFVSAGELCCD
jgi:hypothetical protein